MVGKGLVLGGAAVAVWLNAAVAMPGKGEFTIVSDPVACLELNASGTLVHNRCDVFLWFVWRNRSNCADACETEVAPGALAMVEGLNAFHVYGACRSHQRASWLGWRYSCYPRQR